MFTAGPLGMNQQWRNKGSIDSLAQNKQHRLVQSGVVVESYDTEVV